MQQRQRPHADVGNTGDAATKTVETKRRRRRKNNHSEASEFANDVQPVVEEVGNEYQALLGDIFRTVFGGSIVGVSDWLRSNGDPNVYDSSTGWTPLIMATSMGDPDMVQLLVERGANLRLGSTTHGWQPVHMAIWKNSCEMLSLIVKMNESCVREKTADGSTALLLAIESAPVKVQDDMVRILLEGHADPNCARVDGWSPLALAVRKNLRQAIKLLVQNRGNIFDEFPETDPRIAIWQAAAKHPGLQALIKSKLNSRDVHMIEKRWPGTTRKIMGGDD